MRIHLGGSLTPAWLSILIALMAPCAVILGYHGVTFAYERRTVSSHFTYLFGTDSRPSGYSEVDYNEGIGVGLSALFRFRGIPLGAMLDYHRYDATGIYKQEEKKNLTVNRFALKVYYLYLFRKWQWLSSGHGFFYNYIEYPSLIRSFPGGKRYDPYTPARFEDFDIAKLHVVGYDANLVAQYSTSLGLFLNGGINLKIGFGFADLPKGFEADYNMDWDPYMGGAYFVNVGYEIDYERFSGGISIGYKETIEGNFEDYENSAGGRDFELKPADLPLSGLVLQVFLRF